MTSCFSSSYMCQALQMRFARSMKSCSISVFFQSSMPFNFTYRLGLQCCIIKKQAFLLFSSEGIQFLLVYLYLFFQTKISTLLTVSSGASGTLMPGLSILLLEMNILDHPCLYLTSMNLDTALHLFKKYAACLCFPKQKTLSLSPRVDILKMTFVIRLIVGNVGILALCYRLPLDYIHSSLDLP